MVQGNILFSKFVTNSKLINLPIQDDSLTSLSDKYTVAFQKIEFQENCSYKYALKRHLLTKLTQ